MPPGRRGRIRRIILPAWGSGAVSREIFDVDGDGARGAVRQVWGVIIAMLDLTKALLSGQVLLMDGAMGTQLQRAGIPASECYEALNLTQPELVRAIHE